MKKFFLGLICMGWLTSVFATVDPYVFNTVKQQRQFQNLTHELRCLVCQNQDIAESNAPLADDLRKEVYAQVQQEKTDREIIDYLTARYGDFILYKPPVKQSTYALWLGPFIILVIAFLILGYFIRKAQPKQKILSAPSLEDQE